MTDSPVNRIVGRSGSTGSSTRSARDSRLHRTRTRSTRPPIGGPMRAGTNVQPEPRIGLPTRLLVGQQPVRRAQVHEAKDELAGAERQQRPRSRWEGARRRRDARRPNARPPTTRARTAECGHRDPDDRFNVTYHRRGRKKDGRKCRSSQCSLAASARTSSAPPTTATATRRSARRPMDGAGMRTSAVCRKHWSTTAMLW